MRFTHKRHLSTGPEKRMNRTAVLALLLSLAASPALASDASSDASVAAANFAAGTTSVDQDAADIRRITARIAQQEQSVGQLGVADPPPARTAAELKRAEQEEERQAEFQHQVWTMP